jgi:hypothetical protein
MKLYLVALLFYIGPDHQSSSCYFSKVRAVQSLVFCVVFVDQCLSFFAFSVALCCLSFYISFLIFPVEHLKSFLVID